MSLNNMIREALEEYDTLPNFFGMGELNIGEFSGMEDMRGNKPYQYRGEVSVTLGKNLLEHTLVIIGLGPQQGTGNNSDYSKLDDEKGTKLLSQETPRKNIGGFNEFLLPILDLNQKEGDELGRTSLDYITLYRDTLERYHDVGTCFSEITGKPPRTPNHGYGEYIKTSPYVPLRSFQYNFYHNMPDFPHAFYNPKSYDQVVAFLKLPYSLRP